VRNGSWGHSRVKTESRGHSPSHCMRHFVPLMAMTPLSSYIGCWQVTNPLILELLNALRPHMVHRKKVFGVILHTEPEPQLFAFHYHHSISPAWALRIWWIRLLSLGVSEFPLNAQLVIFTIRWWWYTWLIWTPDIERDHGENWGSGGSWWNPTSLWILLFDWWYQHRRVHVSSSWYSAINVFIPDWFLAS